MKKIMITLLVLFSFISVNADEYLIGKHVYCGNDEVVVSEKIGKSNKLLAVNINTFEEFIWNEDNTCSTLTIQDYLDYYNSSSTYYKEDDNRLNIIYYNYDNENDYILSNKPYNKDTVYYEYDNVNNIMEISRVTSDEYQVNTYYVIETFKSPDSAIIDSNITYYEFDKDIGSDEKLLKVVDVPTDDNVLYYYVMTTLEDAILNEIVYNYDDVLYDNLRDSCNQTNLQVINDELFLVCTNDNTNIKYYDDAGNEVLEYKNLFVLTTESYKLLYNYSDNTLKIYDINTNNYLTSITLDNGYELLSTGGLVEHNGNIYLASISGSSVVDNYVKVYKVLDGDNQTYNNKDLTVRFNGSYKLFDKVLINNTELDNSNYTSKEGSTIITLNNSYLNSLSNGTYTLTATYTDGASISTNFTINRINNPNTLDNIYIYYTIGIISLFSLISYLFISKKEN